MSSGAASLPTVRRWHVCRRAWTRTANQVAVGAAQPRSSPRQHCDINAADAPAPAGQYTQAVEVTGASRTLYGQVGIAADGSVPEDAEAQCALA